MRFQSISSFPSMIFEPPTPLSFTNWADAPQRCISPFFIQQSALSCPALPFEQEGRVDNDKHRAGIVHQCAEDRIENAQHRQNDRDEVQNHRETHVHLDGCQHALRERNEVRQLFDIVIDEHNVSSIHGNVAPNTPMATPTLAFFRAGASLMPSPIMQTFSRRF